MMKSNILLTVLFALLLSPSCDKGGEEDTVLPKTPAVSCPQGETGTVLKGETVQVNITNIAETTEVTVKFGKEKTLTRTGPGIVSYAFTTDGLKTVSVTMEPAEVVKTSWKITVEKLETLQSLAQRLRQDPKLCLVMCHRANSSDWSIPENSLPAIEKCVADKIDIVENDVYTTKDGVLVVSHDATINRETTGSGEIKNLTLAQIKAVNLKDRNGKATNYKMLTLDEFLDACKGRIYINIDIGDRNASVPEVVQAVARKGMTQQVLVYCNTAEKIRAAYRTDPDCNVYTYVTAAQVAALVEGGKEGNLYWTQCGYNPTVPEAAANGVVDQSKKPTSASTVANAVAAGTLLSVNAIYTLNTSGFYAKDFTVAQVNDIMKTFPACQCIHVDTGAEARKALHDAGYHLREE